MKKFYFFLCSLLTLISCTNDSTEQEITNNPNLLQRVDFYPGALNEEHWLFNSDGLLNTITKADGTVIQQFTYDLQNRLSSNIIFNAEGIGTTTTFAYDTNNSVVSLNGYAMNYDSLLNAYILGDVNDYYTMNKINSDKLLTHTKTVWIDYDWDGTPIEITESEMGLVYSNNNMVSYFPNESCNYFTFDNNTNPLKNATIAICKAYSCYKSIPWPNINCISGNNIVSHNYCSEDPERSISHYIYNSNNLPVTQSTDYYYFTTLETTSVTAKYYYQGDVLP